MHMTKVPGLLLVLLCCELCSTIKVPVDWDEIAHSEVKNESQQDSQVEIIQPQNVSPHNVHITDPPNHRLVPTEYFEYTAQKPKFAADIAAFHGVQNPQKHYKAYPVKPHTGKQKPALGIHHMLDENKTIYQPFQDYVRQNSELSSHVKPTTSGYEVFHPYEAEEPALKQIYKDPVLSKIRNDLKDSKNRLHAYEQEAGEPNISENEYLESPDKTDDKLFPQKNLPVQYENHRPERRPIYYKLPPRDLHRENLLNKRFRHPWNQNAKIRPVHYRPLHRHIHNLRQQHAMKYDDERNEYPQVTVSENIEEPQDGYDIYEKGKQKYTQLRNNLDESVNKIVQRYRPPTYQKLELQKNEPQDDDDVIEEFVPIKNYAQVRKTATFKHVPKKAAFDDAETYEEIKNAPRLREAVKSTKSQTVYSEEGYEDSAYDHAGEQKHASDHEGHGGFLKEHENSGGSYRIPTVDGKYQDGRGSEYRDNTEHGKKWKNNNKDNEEEIDSEDYSEDVEEENFRADIHKTYKDPKTANRNKRQGSDSNGEKRASNNDKNENNNNDDDDHSSETDSNRSNKSDHVSNFKQSPQIKQNNDTYEQHEVGKREINFKVPQIDLNSTFSIKKYDPKPANRKTDLKIERIQDKYPYYFKKLKGINKHSPLRYAENLKLIPRKSEGGTEFYDSRSQLECPEVDEEVDPIPEKLKNGENPTEDEDEDESESKDNKNYETINKQPRLRGLGDKIDCFKAKYFGENPLDSPFFKEKVISNPEPITTPKLPFYKLATVKRDLAQESKPSDIPTETKLFALMEKLRHGNNNKSQDKTKEEESMSINKFLNTFAANETQQANLNKDILKNYTNYILSNTTENSDASANFLNPHTDISNKTYKYFRNKEDIIKFTPIFRKKRATPFVYEPYKIIRDSQVQDSKKTTTTSNISPLIKQLQSSRVADRVSRSNKDDKSANQKTTTRTYVDIGRKERAQPERNNHDNSDATFVDVTVDQRRGEPRYEFRLSNHKMEYTPVENKRAMSLEAYKSQTNAEKNKQRPMRGRQRIMVMTTAKPDYTQSFHTIPDSQNVAASYSVTKTVDNNPKIVSKEQENIEEDPHEDYEDNNDEEEQQITTTTTTTTTKPAFRRRIKTTTTEKSDEHTTDKPRLKLVTRFRNYKPEKSAESDVHSSEQSEINNDDKQGDIMTPKYREKKKKSQTSTLVTDTKKYGADDEDDMKKEELDAWIGVKHNIDEYMPSYEKEERDRKERYKQRDEISSDDSNDSSSEDDEDYDSEHDDDDDGEADDDDDDDFDDEVERKTFVNPKPKPQHKHGFISTEMEAETTTPEPTKRTLIKTTEAPATTVATHIRRKRPNTRILHKPANKPIVTRKKIEIHKELPVNKSSPHVTEFKQDIKEVEIIKEMPATRRKKPQKIVPALQLYEDDDLAKDINNLSDIELLEEIDLDKGPKHGGNYREATKEDVRMVKMNETSRHVNYKDAETSQSKNRKKIEHDTPKTGHGSNLKLSNINKPSNGRSAKLIELSEPPVARMHGGNLKYDHRHRSDSRKNEKLLELYDDQDEDQSSRQDDEYKNDSSEHEKMHGGNYRSAKLVEMENDDIQVKRSTKNTISSAELLNSFAQAVPILTTTPGYILDPSKRMYYYVEV